MESVALDAAGHSTLTGNGARLAGLRIGEVLALADTDLDRSRGAVLDPSSRQP